jgi:hypothetical protein
MSLQRQSQDIDATVSTLGDFMGRYGIFLHGSESMKLILKGSFDHPFLQGIPLLLD